MARQTRLKIAKRDIVARFEEHPGRILSRADIQEILAENRAHWRLAESTTVNKFIDFMLERTNLQAAKFDLPNRSTTRYTWGEVPVFALVESLKPEGYYTHYTAMHLHGLTDQIPKTVYLNFEQPGTGGGGQLTQGGIDRAFKRKCRVSNNIATYRDHKVCLLNGQHTGQLGVMDLETTHEVRVRVTGIERTLIDATVRPVYSGGVFQVAQAFQMARGRFSVNKLVATLRKLNYTYPYHQAIGFYLEHAGGYKQSQLQLLCQFHMEYDFYLAHSMKETDYIKKWRLFIPQGF